MKKLTAIFVLILLIQINTKNIFATITFSLSNPQTEGNITTVDVNIEGLTANSCSDQGCYLQLAYTQKDQNSYFGYTKNSNGSWNVYNNSSLDKEKIKENFFSFLPVNGAWSGTVTLKIDSEDSSYKGPGIYSIKGWRYSGNSDNSSGDSDNLADVELTLAPTSLTQAPSPITTPTSVAASTNSPKKSPTPMPKASPQKSPSPDPKSSEQPTSTPQVLGTSLQDSMAGSLKNGLESQNTSVPTQVSNVKFAPYLIGSGLSLIGLSILVFYFYKRSLEKNKISKGQERFEQDEQD